MPLNPTINVLEVAYHRNGISTNPFYAIRFRYEGAHFLGIVFPENDNDCAVIGLGLIPTRGVKFGENSWRADSFKEELLAAITKYQQELDVKRGITEPLPKYRIDRCDGDDGDCGFFNVLDRRSNILFSGLECHCKDFVRDCRGEDWLASQETDED